MNFKYGMNMPRPTVMTDETIEKLRQAFLMGASDVEACGFADICRDSLYEYQKSHPEFTDQKEEWKAAPTLKARKTVLGDLENVATAKWYLERKIKKEFSLRTELTGKNGDNFLPVPIYGGMSIAHVLPTT